MLTRNITMEKIGRRTILGILLFLLVVFFMYCGEISTTSYSKIKLYPGLKISRLNGEVKCLEVDLSLTKRSVPVTALASFPGSGSTWTRHLLQKLTGIGTGSIYCDKGLLGEAFPYECYPMWHRLLVVKTHKPPRTEWERALVIIRNPYDAILSFFNFKNSKRQKHVSIAPEAAFITHWREYVPELIIRWRQLAMDYLDDFEKPTQIIIYENLKKNLKEELQSVAKFLNITIPDSRMQCVLMDNEGDFHRPKNHSTVYPIDLYHREFVALINEHIDAVSKVVKLKSHIDISYYKR